MASGILVRTELLSSYALQAYITVVGIVLVPTYLHYMGPEAFGLVGLFIMLQAWMQLLDLGLTPALSREMSLYKAGSISVEEAWVRLRSLEWVLGSFAVIALVGFSLLSDFISTHWLKVQSLDKDVVELSIFAMVLAGACRWSATLYRGVLVGLERQTGMNSASAVLASVKYVGVLAVLAFVSPSAVAFFSYQVFAAGLELLVFAAYVYRVLPSTAPTKFPSITALKTMWPVAGSMAFLSGMWICITQIDKFILSLTLTLSEYGHFTLASLAAGAILLLAPPLSQVLQPRMTILAERGERLLLLQLYRTASQMGALVFSVCGASMAFFAQPILELWSRDPVVSAEAAPILFWYALANTVIGISMFPFMLQFAIGKLRLHVWGNIILLVTLVPGIYYVTLRYGPVGSGQLLFCANLAFLLLWVPLAHSLVAHELIFRWPLRDILPVAGGVVGVLFVASSIMPNFSHAWASAFYIAVSAGAAGLTGALSGHLIRKHWLAWRPREIK